MIIADGVYTLTNDDPLRFHRLIAPSPQQLQTLLNRLIQRIVRRLTKDGLLIQDPEYPWLDLEPNGAMDTLSAASIRYRIALGPKSGGRTFTLRNPSLAREDRPSKPFTVNQDGFSLNAAIACQPQQQDRLERLIRYVTRPAICLERLALRPDGQVQYELQHPFRDGTTGTRSPT